MRVVVTGARGFLGRRVVAAAKTAGHDVVEFNRGDANSRLADLFRGADVVVHLAGVNRPRDPAEFTSGNSDLTEQVANAVDVARNPVVLFSSSTQATLDNPYGVSKRAAEGHLEKLAKRGARVVVFRLPNVFGPGGRPNYNSAVATFAHNAANGLPMEVHDASRELTLVYVHDVAAAMLGVFAAPPATGTFEFRSVAPEYRMTVGALADTFSGYAKLRETFFVPDVSTPLKKALYATYLSCLPHGKFAYDLVQRTDPRGTLAEFLKSPGAGQIFVSRTKPGISRGNHFHHTKTEKFFVLEGDAIVRFRRVDGTGDVMSYPVSGRDFRVVDIPPDHTHLIENVGTTELIVLFWACEVFDPAVPDTTALNVIDK